VDVDQDGKDDIIIGTGVAIDYHLVRDIVDPAIICKKIGKLMDFSLCGNYVDE
jgi:hypothetical protein